MPVLDFRSLKITHLKKLGKMFDQFCDMPIRLIPEIENDETRIKIDKLFSDVLDLPDLKFLREVLAREPILRQNMTGLES